MLEVVCRVGHLSSFVAYIRTANSARAARDLSDRFGSKLHAEDLCFALNTGIEIEGASVFGPIELRGNQVEIVCRKSRSRPACRRSKPDLRMVFLVNASNERNSLPVRRPTRAPVSFVVI